MTQFPNIGLFFNTLPGVRLTKAIVESKIIKTMVKRTSTRRQSTFPAPFRLRDPLGLLWRAFASPRMTYILLVCIAFSLALGGLLPQARFMADMLGISTQRWVSGAIVTYGRWADWIKTLQLINLPYAFWFRALWAMLTLNAIVSGIEGIMPAWRIWRDPFAQIDRALPDTQAQRIEIATNRSPAGTIASLASFLKKQRYTVVLQADEIVAQRHGWVRMAPLIMCLGLLLILGGIVLGQQLGWQEGPFSLIPGQAHHFRHGDNLTLRLEETLAGEPPGAFGVASRTLFTLFQGQTRVFAGRLRKGVPTFYRGVYFTQTDQGPAVAIRASDADGKTLLLRTLGKDGELVPEIGALFQRPDTELWVGVPERGILLHMTLAPSPIGQGLSGQILRAQVYVGTEVEPFIDRIITRETELIIDHVRCMVVPGCYASIVARWNPGLVPIGLGVVLLAAGIIVWLCLSPRLVRIVVPPRRRKPIIEVYAPQDAPWLPPLEMKLRTFLTGAITNAKSSSRWIPSILSLVISVTLLAGFLGIWWREASLLPVSPLFMTPPFALAGGAFTLAAALMVLAGVMSIILLLRDRRGKDPLPGAEHVERLVMQLLSGGTAVLTLALALYGLAAWLAWGNAWSWDPIEIWRMVLWLYCLLILYGRRMLGWSERYLTIGAIIGMCITLFVLFGSGALTGLLGLASHYVST